MRPPDRIIGERYLERWHLIPRNPFFNVYLHRFIGSDDDRALHDHPWWSVSILLRGSLAEVSRTDQPGYRTKRRIIDRFRPVFRSAEYAHRLELLGDAPAWTLFLTGPVVREWGFVCHTVRGVVWKHWSEMTSRDGRTIGGCD